MQWLKNLLSSSSFSVFNVATEWAKKQQLDYESLPSVDSTNDLAKKEAFQIQTDFKLYLTDFQTAGRGRYDRKWETDASGSYLLSTWSYKVKSAPQSVTGPLVGLAIYNAFQESLPHLEWSLKAPNDLYLKDKKVLGVLVETVQKGIDYRLIIGIGLNVHKSPQGVDYAGHIGSEEKLSTDGFEKLLSSLQNHLQLAAKSSGSPSLTTLQRDQLLVAINKHPACKLQYRMISPFGDLISDEQTVSWRDL